MVVTAGPWLVNRWTLVAGTLPTGSATSRANSDCSRIGTSLGWI
jgi:hypothetical protein